MSHEIHSNIFSHSNESLCMMTMQKPFPSNYTSDVRFFRVCTQHWCSVVCIQDQLVIVLPPAHASLWLAHECASDYLMPFPSLSSETELTSKPQRRDYLLSTADLFVEQLVRKLHRTWQLSSGQLVILHSCLLSLTREWRGEQLLGRSGQVTRRRGAVASSGKEKWF